MNKIKRAFALGAIIAVTAVSVWQITIHTAKITVSEDTAHIASFGQVYDYDYDFCNDNPTLANR